MKLLAEVERLHREARELEQRERAEWRRQDVADRRATRRLAMFSLIVAGMLAAWTIANGLWGLHRAAEKNGADPQLLEVEAER